MKRLNFFYNVSEKLKEYLGYMIIQILDSNDESQYPHLNWFKKICDEWAILNEMKKLTWLHAEQYDAKCDVFLKTQSETLILVGYKPDIDSEKSETIRWVEIEIIDQMELDAITQVLLVTVGMGYMRSITGNFSTDWDDILTVLDHGNKGYCCAATWDDFLPLFDTFTQGNKLGIPSKILSSAMLLNQGLTVKKTFEFAVNLSKTKAFSSDALEILNITSLAELPKNNIFLFMSDETNLYSINSSDPSLQH